MGSVAQFLVRAVGLHRQAVALLHDAEAELQALESANAGVTDVEVEQRQLAARPRRLGQAGLRGWLGFRLDDSIKDLPLGQDALPDRPMYLRVGEARPTSDSVFWAVAPFVVAGHLTVDTDARDPAVAPAETTPTGIRQRYRELDQQRAQAEADLAGLIATQPVIDQGTPELLDRMPQDVINLAHVPAAIRRRLYDALKLTVRIDGSRRAHIQITLTEDTPDTTAGVIADIKPDADDDPDTTQPQEEPCRTILKA